METITNVLLRLNGDDALKNVKQLTARLDEAVAAKKRLEDSHLNGEEWTKKDIAALKKLNKEISSCQSGLKKAGMSAEEVGNVLSRLDKATLKELKGSLKQLEKAFANAARGSAEWHDLREKIKAVKAEISAVKDVQSKVTDSGSSIADFGAKWAGVAVVIQAVERALSALFGRMTASVSAYAELAEHTANVSKYTGLAAADVAELNEAFKRMDTRTSRAALNDLAADAGRLGITAKKDILDFVSAADQINVALGADLGEGAVKEIGKLAQMFGDADRMGLKQAMLSTASVINELAQSSSASEGYLMEFTSRLAGVGKQAGLTQAQLFAFGSVLDQNKVNVEKGATAVQNVLTALFSNTDKMATAAGLNVKEFSDLLSRDANEAFLLFISRLNELGGMDKVAPVLKEMNLSGAGVTQMLTTLAANVDAVRQVQEQATEAYRDGTSATNEAAKANATAQAQLEKQQKRLEDLRAELGEALLPIQVRLTEAQITLSRAFAAVIPYLTKYGAAIVALSTYIAANIALTKVKVAWDTIEAAGWRAKTALIWANIQASAAWKVMTQSVTVAMAAFNVVSALLTSGLAAARVQFVLLRAAMLKSPFGLIALAVTAVSYAVAKMTGLFEDDTAAVKTNTDALGGNKVAAEELQRAQQRASDNAAKERTRIELLNAVLHSNASTLRQKREALEEIQKTIPAYLGHLTTEGRLERDNVSAIQAYISSLEDKALAEAMYEELVEQKKRERAARRNRERKENNVRLVQNQLDNNPNMTSDKRMMPYVGIVETNDARLKKEKELEKQTNALTEAQKRENEEVAKSNELSREYLRLREKTGDKSLSSSPMNGTGSTPTGGGGGGTGNTNTEPTPAQKVAAEYEQRRLAEDFAYATGLKSYLGYQAALSRLEREESAAKVEAFAKGTAERVKAERDYYAVLRRQRSEQNTRTIAELKEAEEKETRAAKEQYARGVISEEQYQERLSLIRNRYASKRVKAYEASGDAETAAKERAAAEELAAQDQLARRQAYAQKVAQLEADYSKKTLEEKKAQELALLEELLAAKVITEEQAAQFRKEINEKYRSEQEAANKSAADKEKQTQDELKQKRKEAYDIGTPTEQFSSSVATFALNLQNLFDKIKAGKATWADFANVGISALSAITAMMQSVSQLWAAQQELELKQVEKKYERQIALAGSNSKRAKRLEEKKKKEEAAIKNKYQKKQNKIALATAVIQTAQNALMAYGSLAWIPTVGPVLGAIAAAAALAAGAIQIATIKKQQAAQGEFYVGGYTGGTRYRREAGVVHEGEFVANHLAVNNPALRPVLNLIDSAQRSNTVAALTAEDVSRAVAAPILTTAAAQQTAAVTTSSLASPATDPATRRAIEQLNQHLAEGIHASVSIDGRDGFARQWKRWQKLNGE